MQPSLPPTPPVPAPLASFALAWQQGEQLGPALQGICPLQLQQAGLWQGLWWLALGQAPVADCPSPLLPTPATQHNCVKKMCLCYMH